jgi:hypothetical protein
MRSSSFKDIGKNAQWTLDKYGPPRVWGDLFERNTFFSVDLHDKVFTCFRTTSPHASPRDGFDLI